MPTLDLIDESFIVAAPARIAAVLAGPAGARLLWPDLELTVFQDRGVHGMRWNATGALVGSVEVWIEQWADGAIVHVYLRAELTARHSATAPRAGSPGRLQRAARTEVRRRSRWLKGALWQLKAQLEDGRLPGEPGFSPAPAAPTTEG